MDIRNPIYHEDGTAISATVDGADVVIPVAIGNRHYDELARQRITPAPYTPPTLTNTERIAAAPVGTEDMAQVARKIEDVIHAVENRTPIDPNAIAWKDDRRTKRADV